MNLPLRAFIVAHKLQLEKEEAIRKMVNKLAKRKQYTMEWIFEKVGKQFFLKPKTIQHIMYGQYDKRRNKSRK